MSKVLEIGKRLWCPSIDITCNSASTGNWGLPSVMITSTYSHLGYNLKPLDPQAAIGRVQLRKLPHFIEMRKNNWQKLRTGLAKLSNDIDFHYLLTQLLGTQTVLLSGMIQVVVPNVHGLVLNYQSIQKHHLLVPILLKSLTHI